MSPASGDVAANGRWRMGYTTVSIQLMSPASGDSYETFCEYLLHLVSIQLMSPASGDKLGFKSERDILFFGVSIQLMSPASGDSLYYFHSFNLLSFHSINVPSEWGPLIN